MLQLLLALLHLLFLFASLFCWSWSCFLSFFLALFRTALLALRVLGWPRRFLLNFFVISGRESRQCHFGARWIAISVSAWINPACQSCSPEVFRNPFSRQASASNVCSLLSRITVTAAEPPWSPAGHCVKSDVSCTSLIVDFDHHVAGMEALPSRARLPFSTERTSTPLPPFTPKKSPSWGVMFSTISPLRNEECAITTETGTSMSGIVWILRHFELEIRGFPASNAIDFVAVGKLHLDGTAAGRRG